MSNIWGFDLDMTAVRLMRHDGASWQEVGAEKIEGADIEERLLALVERIDSDAPIQLFLPRDQILYTDVAISSDDIERADVAAAIEGATPYLLEDLDLDWEITEPGTVRVAVIALETLDEAVAFAEVRGLTVGGFSSLSDKADFPRMPAWTNHNILAADDTLVLDDTGDETSEAPVTFASGRVQSIPRPEAGSLSPAASEIAAPNDVLPKPVAPEPVETKPITPVSEPVIQIEYDAPIMQIKAPLAPPLNPGRALSGPTEKPRVRTDIASAVVSQQVASLSPPSVQMRHGGGPFWRIGAVLAIAFLMTIGVASLIWQLLPMGPGSNDIPLSENTGAGFETPLSTVPEIEIAAPAPTDVPEAVAPEIVAPEVVVQDEPSAEPALEPLIAEAPAAPDLPQPQAIDAVAGLATLSSELSPTFAALVPVTYGQAPKFNVALRSGGGLPFVDLGIPLEPTPEAL
ncbi:hypothetical protein N9L47_14005, partial [Rhodobacteraceae bacterium]|nr:hypothetical protein [Paracoccaceae bacterium]